MSFDNMMLHDSFRLLLSRKNSDYSKHFEPNEIDIYLNRALNRYVLNRLAIKDTNPQVRVDLQVLEVPNIPLALKSKPSENDFEIFEIPKDFLHLSRQTLFAKREVCCKEEKRRELRLEIVKRDKIDQIKNNPYWLPSYDWKYTFGYINSQGLQLWTNRNFEIVELIIDYYRKPKPIYTPQAEQAGYYILPGGKKITKTSTLELTNSFQPDHIIDLAVLEAFKSVGDMVAYNEHMKKIEYNEKVYINN